VFVCILDHIFVGLFTILILVHIFVGDSLYCSVVFLLCAVLRILIVLAAVSVEVPKNPFVVR